MIQQKISFFENYYRIRQIQPSENQTTLTAIQQNDEDKQEIEEQDDENINDFHQIDEKQIEPDSNQTNNDANTNENWVNVIVVENLINDDNNITKNRTRRINQLITNEIFIKTEINIENNRNQNDKDSETAMMDQTIARQRRINRPLTEKLDAKTKREQYRLSRNLEKLTYISTSISDLLDIYDDFDHVCDSIYDEGADEQSTRTACIIRELIDTEENYVEGLKTILVYKEYLENYLPSDIKDNIINDIFYNIEEIYKRSQKFLKTLKRRTDISNVNSAFIQSESMLDLYVAYVRNKPLSDVVYDKYATIIKYKQDELKDTLGLSSYLLTPIQRLGRYILLLERIEGDLIKRNQTSTYVRSNIDKLKKIMRLTNDYLIIDLIKKCPNQLNLTAQGSFILKETFILHKPFEIPEVVVCLFENVVVFTLSDRNSQQLLYMKHIFLHEIKLIYRVEDELIFSLEKDIKDKRIDGTMSRFVLEAANQGIKQRWIEIIENILWEQLRQARTESLKRSLKPYSEEAVQYIQNCKPLKLLVEETKCNNINLM